MPSGTMAEQGKLDEAFSAYRDGLAIAERPTATDPGNSQWQRALLMSREPTFTWIALDETAQYQPE
jgi:hypothetical protein